MQRILVTGATGELGSVVVRQLHRRGLTIRAMSRRPQPRPAPAAVEWVTADLTTGQGLAAAVAGVTTIIHAATNPLARWLASG